MSATFIEKIKQWILYMSHTSVREHGIEAELLSWAIIAGICGVIWLIGDLIYRWEARK